MSALFELAMPWWEFVLRALVVYVALLVLVRLSGKRSVGQFTPFDMILLVLLGTAVQNSLIGEDVSLLGGLILAATLIGLNYLVGFITSRSAAADRLIEGVPVVLARDGKLFDRVLKRQLVSTADFEEAMRQAGCIERDQVKLALLETNGQITIIQHAKKD
ncbi:MAG: YetF domain-containing protein [Pseudoxanthomonas sp.]